MAKMSHTAPQLSVHNIIFKYCNYRRAKAAIVDARIELLGYIALQICPSRFHSFEIFEKAPFQHDVLSEEEKNFLLDNAAEAVDILCSPTESIGSFSEFMMQPAELTQLAVASLKGIPEGTTVYNPFAGMNSYAVTAPQYHFVGEEINQQTWAAGQVRLMVHGVDAYIQLGDSNTAHRGDMFKAIITTPPFGLRGDLDQWERMYDMLDDGGRLVMIAPTSLTFNGRYRRLWKRWREDRTLATIVQLPSRLFFPTDIASILVVLEKCDHRTVRMIDASTLGTNSKMRSMTLGTDNVDMLTKLLQGGDALLFKGCIDVPFEAINPTKAISPHIYISEQSLRSKGLKNLIPLYFLLEPYRCRLRTFQGEVHEVKIKNLAENLLDSVKDFADLPPVLSSDKFPLILNENNILLIATSGQNPKPTIFRYVQGSEHTVVCSSHNIAAFKLKRDVDLVGLDYIVSELYKPYVQEQLEAVHVGRYIAHVAINDFLWIRISVPSLERHDSMAEERSITDFKIQYQQELLAQTGIQLRELQDQKHDRYVKIMHQRKHALGQVLQEIKHAVNLIQYAAVNNDGIVRLTDIVSTRSHKTIDAELQGLKSQTERIINMVDSLTDDTEFEKPEEVSLYDLLEQFQRDQLNDHYELHIAYETESGFTIDKSYLEENGLKYRDYKISFAPAEFIQVLQNIASNAVKYGFDEDDKLNIIQISVSPSLWHPKSAISIRIANNGKPLPKGMTPEKVFTQGVTSGKGQGLGGWHTRNIVEFYGGNIELESHDDSEFKVEYIINLPFIESYEV